MYDFMLTFSSLTLSCERRKFDDFYRIIRDRILPTWSSLSFSGFSSLSTLSSPRVRFFLSQSCKIIEFFLVFLFFPKFALISSEKKTFFLSFFFFFWKDFDNAIPHRSCDQEIGLIGMKFFFSVVSHEFENSPLWIVHGSIVTRIFVPLFSHAFHTLPYRHTEDLCLKYTNRDFIRQLNVHTLRKFPLKPFRRVFVEILPS